MNYGISVLFRTIPLLMALFCFGYGAFVLDMGTDPAKNVAGPVVMSLGMICIALFATAATIIRQIIHTYNTVVRYALPVLGYLAALLTFICGWEYISEAATASHFVAGHVICGVAFITACVATTATSSTRFTLIPANSQTTENNVLPQAGIAGTCHLDMDIPSACKKRCAQRLLCSRACHGRNSLHLYKPRGTGGNYRTPNT